MENGHLPKKSYSYLAQNHHGGGSPGLSFLKKLETGKHYNLKVSTFKDVARDKFGRWDIYEFLNDNFSADDKMCSMTLINKQKLGSLLDKNSVSNYKDFASHYGMSHIESQQLEQAMVIPNEFDPTEELFQEIARFKPGLSLDIVITGVTEILKMDAASNLKKAKEKIIKEKQEKQQQQQHITQDIFSERSERSGLTVESRYNPVLKGNDDEENPGGCYVDVVSFCFFGVETFGGH